jgi:hypothetical protein
MNEMLVISLIRLLDDPSVSVQVYVFFFLRALVIVNS